MTAKRCLALAWIAAAVLVPAGCTNSDPLTPGSGSFELRIAIANTPTRFDDAYFYVRQVMVAPDDPLSESALAEPLAVINPRSSIELNGNLEGTQLVVSTNLGTGPWRVSGMLLDTFFYRDFDPPPSTSTCADFITFYQPSPNMQVFLGDFGGQNHFSIEPGTTKTLTITIDHQLFVPAFQEGFRCVSFGQFYDQNRLCTEPWCIFSNATVPATYSPGPLFLAAPQYLSFE